MRADSSLRLNQFAERLISVSAASTGLGIISTWILSSYFKVDVVASHIWFGNDKWCKLPSEAIGLHCFGDFHERVAISSFGVKNWPTNLELGPIMPFFTMFYNFLGESIGMRPMLLLVLIGYFSLLLTPLIWATKQKPLLTRVLTISTLGLSSLPFLAAMDRGNFIVISTPFLILFLIGARRARIQMILIAVVSLAAIKPQFLLLAVFFLVIHRYRVFVVTVLASLTLNLVLIVGAGGGDFGRIHQWLQAVLDSSSTAKLKDDFPTNISFSKGFYNFFSVVDSIVGFLFRFHENHLTANFYESNSSLISFSLYALLVLCLIWFGTRLPIALLSCSLIVLACIGFGNYIPTYYLLFVISFSAIAIRSPIQVEPTTTEVSEFDHFGTQRLDRFLSSFLLWCITWSSSCIIVPWSLSFNSGQNLGIDPSIRAVNLMSKLTPLLWFVFLVFTIIKAKRVSGSREIKNSEWAPYQIIK
jgi:hypothetical protein